MPFICEVPALCKVLVDNDVSRVTRLDFTPGATTGMHTHGLPYFVVMLTPGILHAEVNGVVSEHVFEQGTTYMRAAGMQHDIRNASPHDVSFIEIEIKKVGFLD